MLLQNILTALIPLPLFYLIYYRYFTFKPEYVKHLESFLYGVALALFIILVSPYIYSFMPFSGSIQEGFLKAALIEKFGAFCLIYLIHRYYPNFSLMESIVSSMMLGMGFSLVENIFYAINYGYSIILVRLIVSVPLHLTTCGFIGYYMGLRKLSTTSLFRASYTVKALVIPFLLHGTFDAVLLTGGMGIYFICPMLILLVMILEIMIAWSHNVYPLDILDAMKLRFEDWLSIEKQPRYDRWILQSMGTPNTTHERLFRLQRSVVRWLLIVLFLAAAGAMWRFRPDIVAFMNLALKPGEDLVIFTIFPASISMILLMVGATNPKFFEDSLIRIPIITDVSVRIPGNEEETFVTYDITSANCFFKTSDPLGIDTEIEMVFECPGFSSPPVKGRVIWENFVNMRAPLGSIVHIIERPKGFYRFLLRYAMLKFKKGLVFNLKLPGFEMTRKLFMRPISTMQQDVAYPSGTIIFNEGEIGHEFFLIKRGRVMFYKKKDSGDIIVMDTMEAGEIFGEMSLVGNHGRAATAVCSTDCVIAKADIDNLNALIKFNPEFAISLIKKLAERVNMSESILTENIRNLEKEKIENQRYFHVSMLLTLIGLGYSPTQDNLELKIDLKKIESVLKHLDDNTASELINLVMEKQKGAYREDSDFSKHISDEVDRLASQFKIDIKY